MAWLVLILARILEIIWAFFMKQSIRFTKIIPSIITIVTMIASVVLLSFSMKTIPLGTAYTIWTGIGMIGAFVVDIFILNEPANAIRILAACLIISGLLIMKLSSHA